MTRSARDPGIRVEIGRDALDGVIIEAGPDSVLGLQPVDLADMVEVFVDPLDPARLVRATCADIDESAWLLDELLGHGAAAAVADAENGPADRRFAIVQPTEVARDVGRLGMLLWLSDTSPLPLDQGLLDAELAAAFHAMPGAPAAEQARRLGRSALPTAVALGADLGDGTSDPPSTLADSVFRVAGALLAVAAPTSADLQALVELATSARSAAAAATVRRDMDADLLRLFDSEAAATTWDADLVRAGGLRERRFSIDWRVVPRGVLDSREGTIRVTWTPGEPGVNVRVPEYPVAGGLRIAAGGSRTATDAVPLLVRVVPADGTAPRALTPLRYMPESASYHAVLDIETLSDGDRVDVFSAAASVAPLLGPAAEQRAAGLRCAARALTAMRLAPAAPPAQAPALWRSAADEWMEWLTQHLEPDGEHGDRDRDVVFGALARCQRGLGSPLADRTAARRRDPGTEPLWSDPAAALSLAEGRLLGFI